ncbi:MAG: threonine synthase, partial [Flavobacteriales bacterium]|nr:threonine synthase [Flavobacteriales bacterium]
ANAMGVGDPSNFVRLQALFGNDDGAVRASLKGFSMTDEQILETIAECYASTGYILDPHGAIGYQGLKQFGNGIFLETAHPAKFKATVEKAIGKSIDLPEPLAEALVKEGKAIKMDKQYTELKQFLMP